MYAVSIWGDHPAIAVSPGGHYTFLVDGFLHGQTYLTEKPDPRLASLKNPFAGWQGIPRMHDASYYHGRYYLYFGAAPALLVGVPIALLTGRFVDDAVTTGVLTVAGTAAAMFLLVTWIRRFGASAPPRARFVAIIGLGFATFVPALLQSPAFYQVPIAGAYASITFALAFLYFAMDSDAGRRRSIYFAMASVAWGLAVGSRPNMVMSIPALGLALLFAIRRELIRERRWSWPVWRLVACALFPTGLIGVGLMIYNYARFDSVFEFGTKYQLTGADQTNIRVFSLAYIFPNLREYLLSACDYQPYYPFVELGGPTTGVITWTPFLLLGGLMPAYWLRRDFRVQRGYIAWSATALVTAFLLFASLLCWYWVADRYSMDFLPTWGLVAAFVLVSANGPGTWDRMVRGIAIFACAFSVFHAGLFVATRSPLRLKWVARIANIPVWAWDHFVHANYGPIEAKITFAHEPAGVVEPVLSTGRGRDLLYIEHRSQDRICFRFLHLGTITPYGPEIGIAPGIEHTIKIDLGSLYPPREYPSFWNFPDRVYDAQARRIEVAIDGRTAFKGSTEFYTSTPSRVIIGKDVLNLFATPRFLGTIRDVRHLGLPDSPTQAAGSGWGPARLKIVFPAYAGPFSEPLVSVGAHGYGDLIYATYMGPRQIRFGHDSSKHGAIESPLLDFDPGKPHVIDVDLPNLAARNATEISGLAQIRFDGALVLSQPRTFAPAEPGDVVFGYNAVGASAAGRGFTGPKLEVEHGSPQPPPSLVTHGWGAVRLLLSLPLGRPGTQEPLVVTGRQGAGNLFYIRYLNERQIEFGYDHWGIGGFVTEPIDIDYHPSALIEVSFGSLFPPANDPWWAAHSLDPSIRDCVVVRLNGRVVVDRAFASHPAALNTIVIGQNLIGGSTCDERFTGTIHAVENILSIGRQ